MNLFFLMQDTRALYGAERATLRLVSGLASAGAQVRVLFLDEARLDSSAPSPLGNRRFIFYVRNSVSVL